MSGKFRRVLTIFAGLILILLAAGAGLVRYLIDTPYKGYAAPKTVVTIPAGSSVNMIAKMLHKKGMIRHPLLLTSIFIFRKTEGQSKAGDYVFDRALSPVEVYEKLMKGEIFYNVITVPEGSNLFDIASIVEAKGVGKPGVFERSLQSKEALSVLHSIVPGVLSAEGFLFPETYFLGKIDGPQKLVLVMLGQFRKHYGVPEQERAKALGLTTVQVITLASLIEKETGRPSERPLISGVFYNRLKRSMLLQCDPTVIYALLLAGEYSGRILRQDLQRNSPYNTYVHSGLPPGPICNPGSASIQAALYPEETDKLYFVSKNDGTHYFAATLEEHNRAVQRYQRNKYQKSNIKNQINIRK